MRRGLTVIASGALALGTIGMGSADAASAKPRHWQTKNTIGCVSGWGNYKRGPGTVTITMAKVRDRCEGKNYALIQFFTTKGTHTTVRTSPTTLGRGHNRTVTWPRKITLRNAQHLWVAECLVRRSKGKVKIKACGKGSYRLIY
jgi:hypothetical protein